MMSFYSSPATKPSPILPKLRKVKSNTMNQSLQYKTYQVRAEQHSSLYWAASDIGVFIQRSLRHIFKNKDQLLGLTIQPIMFMLLFRYVFGGAINTGGTTYVN